ncbi:MAG: hypothetical protein KDI06_12785 [Calditrichaeota bacterium]|nr:hypothetical protein [Calditrichota bacterium]
MTLQKANQAMIMLVIIVLVASVFLGTDIWATIGKYVPRDGWGAFLLSPIFAHKVSEIVIAFSWILWAGLHNYEKAGEWPGWISENGAKATINAASYLCGAATVLGTYAWTGIILGTSELTTAVQPIVAFPEEDALVWALYLGAVVVAGLVFTLLMSRRYGR